MGAKEPVYLNIYRHYRTLILEGALPGGARMPSIRQCAAIWNVSRTTAEAAYGQLASEGYILSKPQSGFYVTRLHRTPEPPAQAASRPDALPLRYDFTFSGAPAESFNLDIWRRYVKSALRQGERLLSYGDPQGEYDLREALAGYLERERNAVCAPGDIVVGAGVQSLLHILCAVLPQHSAVEFRGAPFLRGQAVMEDHGMRAVEADADILYLTPCRMTRWGEVLPVEARIRQVDEAAGRGMMLVEDDYGHEFPASDQPIPSLQGMAGGRNVAYLGTFSRLLLPSIRLSFMILPRELRGAYHARAALYNQTASKTEQIALCQYLRDGHLQRQIRHLRRNCAETVEAFIHAGQNVFVQDARIYPAGGYRAVLEIGAFSSPGGADALMAQARRAGILLERPGEGPFRLLLSCAALAPAQFGAAWEALKAVVYASDCP